MHLKGTWPWMATELSHVGPGKPMDHKPKHDLELFFYVLLGVCLLFEEPNSLKSNAQLLTCFDPCFAVFKPSIHKTLIIQSDFGWTALVLPNISPYFQPIIPLLERIRNDFILSVKMDDGGKLQSSSRFTHSTFLSLLADALISLSPTCWETHDSMPRSVNKKSETLPPFEFASVPLPSKLYPPQQAPTILSPAPVQAPNPHQQLNTSPSSVCLQTALLSSAPT